jgi:hypothetical protein
MRFCDSLCLGNEHLFSFSALEHERVHCNHESGRAFAGALLVREQIYLNEMRFTRANQPLAVINALNSFFSDHASQFWEAAEILQRETNYPYEMMPLLFALIKSTGGNATEATKLIQEGRHYEKNGILKSKDSNCSTTEYDGKHFVSNNFFALKKFPHCRICTEINMVNKLIQSFIDKFSLLKQSPT